MKFKVNKDKWLVIIMYISVLSIFAAVILIPGEDQLIGILSGIATALIILPILWVGYYELKEDHLYIRIWFLFKRIKYKNIESIEEARGMQNNFALARERVRIREFGKAKFNYTDISPVDRERFIMELRHRVTRSQNQEF